MFLALALGLAAGPARAGKEPLTWSPEASELNARGAELSRAGDHPAAYDAYLAAYRAMPDPLRYHLARDSVFGSMRSSLYSLYEATGEVKYLCHVRRILLEHWEALMIAFGEEAEIPDEPGIRRRLRDVDAEMRAHVPGPGETECVVRTGPHEPATADIARLIPAEMRARAAAPPSPREATPRPERESDRGAPPDRVEGAEPAPATAPAAPSQADRKRRARVGGGVALLLAGGGLVGGMVGALVRRGELTRTFRDLEATIEGEGRNATADEYSRAAQLNRDYGTLTFAAGACGVAGLGAVVGGIVLLSLRPRQVVALPWSGPRAAGFTVQGRF